MIETMSETHHHDILAGLVTGLVDVDPGALGFSAISTGKHNSSFWVESDQGRFVLRIAPRDDAGFLFYERLMMRQEPGLHGLIREKTTIPVAEVVGHDFSRRRIDRDYLLMRALPGTPLSDFPGLTSSTFHRTLRQVGECLRQLHGLDAAGLPGVGERRYGYLGEHRPMEPCGSWAEAFRVMWGKLLDDVAACGSYTRDEARWMRDLPDRFMGCFDRPVVPSLLHMDVWSQNILIDGRGNVTGIVDFDRALWGDVEIEFAVLDYCGVSEPAFWEGYGSPRDASPPAMIRRRFYLLYEMQKYMPIRVWRRNNPAAAKQYKQQCLAMAAQLRGGDNGS